MEDNARLQRNLTERVEEVRASRARLIVSDVEERRRLEHLLEDGAVRYLGDSKRS